MKTKTEYDWITCSYCGYLYGKNSYMYKTNHYIRNLVLSWYPTGRLRTLLTMKGS
jgi:hypothetical protein